MKTLTLTLILALTFAPGALFAMGNPWSLPSLTYPEDYCKPNKEGKVPAGCPQPQPAQPAPGN